MTEPFDTHVPESAEQLARLQRLSALMDAEGYPFERQLALHDCAEDAEMRARWADWHLLRDVLRGLNTALADDLAGRVADVIEQLQQQPRRRLLRWPDVRVAAAAAAAVVFLATGWYLWPQLADPTSASALAPTIAVADPESTASVPVSPVAYGRAPVRSLRNVFSEYEDRYIEMYSAGTGAAPVQYGDLTLRASWVPDNFRIVQRASDQITYSDGASRFTIYAEPVDRGQARRNRSLVMMSSRRGDWSVTLVGDLPPSLARRVVERAELRE